MNSSQYAQTGIRLLELSESCAADPILCKLLSDTAATVFERASQLLRPSMPIVSGASDVESAPPVEMPPLEEIQAVEWRTVTIDAGLAAAPAASVAPSRATTLGTGPNKFQDWVREMKLPAGAKFAILKAGRPEKEFRLSFTRQGKAILTTSFADGTVITGSSPSAVYRAYIKKMTGRDCGQVDAWKKIFLQPPGTPAGTASGWMPISSPTWLLLEIDSSDWTN